MHEVAVSDHAIARYRERVRPGLSFRAAEAELLATLACASWLDEAPGWAGRGSHDGYVALGDAIVFPAERDREGGGELVLTTCLVRGGASDEVIERRRHDKKWARATRHANADDRRSTSRRRYEELVA